MAKKAKIGIVMKQARLRMGKSAEDVAAACNVSRSRVYTWEKENYVFPKNFPALAETLNIPIRRLRETNGNPPIN